jgi:hypothetical protein
MESVRPVLARRLSSILQVSQGTQACSEELRKPRDCSYYIKYEPAYTPEEHKELQREQKTNRLLRNATLLGAAVGGVMGAVGAIAAQLIYAAVTR